MNRISSLTFLACLLLISGRTYGQPIILGDSTKSWVQIQVNIPEFFVKIDNKIVNFQTYEPGDSVLVPSGKHTLTIVGENVNDYRINFDVLPHQTVNKNIVFTSFPKKPRSSYQVMKSKITVRINTDPHSEIYVNDIHQGTNHIELFLPPGRHKLYIVHPEYGDLKKTIHTTFSEINEIYRYNKPPKGFSTITKFIPGIGYISQKRITRAKITYILIGGAAASWFVLNSKYNDKSESYNSALSLYNKAITSEQAIKYRLEANKYLDQMTAVNLNMKRLVIGTGLLYLITTIDGFIKPRKGYSYKPKLEAKISRIGTKNYSALTFRVDL